DARPAGAGPVERLQHQVEIDRQSVHQDNLVRQRADEASGWPTQLLLVGVPGRLALEMRLNAETGPVVQLLFQERPYSPGLQAERVAAQVDERSAVGADRQVKQLPATAQRVAGVEVQREAFVGPEGVGVRPRRAVAGCGRHCVMPSSLSRNA